ncbi:MAG: diacylglycerol/polyprenol kinase family protein [Promethearchaeota archaeon]
MATLIVLFMQIIVYSSLLIIIIALLTKGIQSMNINFQNREKTKDNHGFESTYGEPLNLLIMTIILIIIIILIYIRVGFQWTLRKQDHPAIILSSIPVAYVLIGIVVNIIQYSRGIKKPKSNGEPIVNTLEISGEIKQKIDYRRKFWHVLVFTLVISIVFLLRQYLVSAVNGTLWVEHYQQLLDGFFDYTDGTSFIDNIFIRKTPPMGQSTIIIFMYGMVIFMFTIELTRLSGHVFFLFQKKVQSIMREKEKNTFGSYTHFATGFLFAAWILPPFPFLAAMCLGSFADPIASIIGMKFGRKRYSWNGKSIEGTIAGMVMAFGTMIIFVGWIYALIGSVVFAIIDIITPRPLEVSDNILMPIIISIIFVLLSALGIPYIPLINF